MRIFSALSGFSQRSLRLKFFCPSSSIVLSSIPALRL
jgi:hypothetical protein